MKSTLIFLMLGLMLGSGLCWAQAPANCTPNPLNIPEAKYPCIFPDNRVMYRVIAPNAQSVRVGSLALTKGPDNIWSGTTPQPVVEGFHYYGVNIDGATVADPSTRTYFGSGWWNSGIEIPAPDQEFYQPRNGIPHGRVSEQWYFSTVTNKWRRCFVYTPPDYDGKSTKYPVFYLLHGWGEDETAWFTQGRVDFIMDNLIAEKKAKPMIVVMPAGHTGPFRFGPPANRSFERQMDEFGDDFVKDVKPYVEGRYRIVGDRVHRAIAGLSMGGAESLLVGLNNLDKFAYIGAFSSGGFTEEYEKQFPGLDTKANEKIRLLWIACGTDDGLIEANRKFRAWLKDKGVKHEDIETPGAHTWMVWRRNLATFTPLLFQGM